jgi:hypothetical protein
MASEVAAITGRVVPWRALHEADAFELMAARMMIMRGCIVVFMMAASTALMGWSGCCRAVHLYAS